MEDAPEMIDWLSIDDQEIWFERFKSEDNDGIKFSKFQEFLKATVYVYFSQLSLSSKQSTKSSDETRFTYQQELQLFKSFDLKNDHSLDRDEFGQMCQVWLEKTFHPASSLVIIDVQNDFIDGSLALINGPAGEDGADVVPVINELIEKVPFELVVYTLDWHPANHIGFFENLHLRKYTLKENNSSVGQKETNNTDDQQLNNVESNLDSRFKLKRLNTKAKVFDSVLFEDGRVEQKLWPTHCVQNSWGAELHPKLKLVENGIKIYKGTLPNVDAYSAFWDNQCLNETNLRQELISRKISEVFFCGVAYDYCVSASALDSVKAGFITLVIEDACRGIDKTEKARRRKEMADNGIMFVNSASLTANAGHLPLSLIKSICFKRAVDREKVAF